MRKTIFLGAFIALLAMLLPVISFAQSGNGMAGSITGLQPVLDQVYRDMMPLCSKLIGVARGLAGFGALWYIASRVWRHIANAEPVDFYPLLRPFALGLAIILFPMVIGVLNGVLQPVVSATGGMVRDSDKAIAALLKQKEEAIKKSTHWQMYIGETGNGDENKWYRYTHPKDPNREKEGMFEGVGNDIKFWLDRNAYNFKNSIKQWMSEVLQVLFAAAALCINTVRTFYLIVMAILGPLVFGFAVYDGFQHTLTVWLARYINIFMWLPVANIFGAILGKIQENMLKIDLSQIGQAGDTFFSPTDVGYLVFMVIGIVGYFTVPNVANYIVHAGGGNAMLQKVNMLVVGGSSTAANTGIAAGGMVADAMGDAWRRMNTDKAGGDQNNYLKDKLKG
ncbi:conjugative transposon protein TraJ [Pararcticibacter amylolyticus]|uniref:Conjugative transposon protein TraJ n=1 Tax=Pararcticibacter amylolyticus TaxID=2173175 RepID=A0A2U2PHD7_9SPHI|nr:conjugative transposon protein TraJ [Pararcticibacter amylolyticus]PWG80801.1 conjugative transposon protein TraJ [Pararcticibacter amylolyticus]